MENKKTEITWWHLFLAGAGISFLYSINNSVPSFLMRILIDLLLVFGMGWGILILIKYLFKKYKTNKFAKIGIVVGIFLSVFVILCLVRFAFTRNSVSIEQSNTVLYQNCINEANKAYEEYKSFNLNDYCSKNKIVENCALPSDQEYFINGLLEEAKKDCIKNYPQK